MKQKPLAQFLAHSKSSICLLLLCFAIMKEQIHMGRKAKCHLGRYADIEGSQPSDTKALCLLCIFQLDENSVAFLYYCKTNRTTT